MKRYSALLRDTWWLWIILVVAGIIFGSFVSFVFFVAIPISIFAFVYFGMMRYDDDGNPIGEDSTRNE